MRHLHLARDLQQFYGTFLESNPDLSLALEEKKRKNVCETFSNKYL